ncbi:hypothetical protein ACW9KT_20160 [Hymenobacter sp. HD11105]
MRITFLCGSLDPGLDGVGDYTRRLAVELILRAHQITIIALNDKTVSTVATSLQYVGSTSVPVLRIPDTLSDKDRYTHAHIFIKDFRPDLLSLQFVLFSFHPKGLPYFIAKGLGKLGEVIPWHIMFHELWVGMPTHSSKKHIVWGWAQQFIIRALVSRLKPRIISTQTWLYQKQLAKLNIQAYFLPLFSNIPYNRSHILPVVSDDDLGDNRFYNLVVFGTIHPYSLVEDFIKEVILFNKSSNKEIRLHAVGHCGPELDRWESTWVAAGLLFKRHGTQSPEQISVILRHCSVGITTTALPMVQKSGSVAAMREHGLPVICISGPWQPRNLTVQLPPLGIFELQRGVFDKCNAFHLDRDDSFNDAAAVAQLFLRMIETSNQ